jgi:hypothetical protein
LEVVEVDVTQALLFVHADWKEVEEQLLAAVEAEQGALALKKEAVAERRVPMVQMVQHLEVAAEERMVLCERAFLSQVVVVASCQLAAEAPSVPLQSVAVEVHDLDSCAGLLSREQSLIPVVEVGGHSAMEELRQAAALVR